MLHIKTCEPAVMGLEVQAAGCFTWAASNLAIAASSSLHATMALAAFNGLGLALVIPCSQSLIADYSAEKSRGAVGQSPHVPQQCLEGP